MSDRARILRFALPLALFALALPPGARAQSQAPATPFLEELTFSEIRDLIAAGYRTVIVPTGGT